MSYNEWLDTLVSPIQYFLNWLINIADSLIHNYFVITLLGITLFISLVWFIFYFIFDFIDKINNSYDDYNDKYYNYELFKKVQSDYLDNHYTDEYDYRYRSKVLNLQVSNGVLQQNPDLVSNVKNSNYKLDVEALKDMQYQNLTDDNPFNDNDVSIISNISKTQLANTNELHKNIIEEFPNLHNDLVKKNNEQIDKILLENGYIDYKGQLVNIDSGEIVLSDNEKNKILQKDFEDYNSLDIFENDFIRESKDTFNEEYRKGVYK